MTTTPVEQPSTFARIKNWVRFWLNVRANVTVVLSNQGAIAQALANSVAMLNQMNARLHWYEKRVPLIAKEYAAFKHQERKLMMSAQADANYAEREARRASVGDDAQPSLIITP